MTTPIFSSAMPSMPVADLEQAIGFYTGALGFALDFRNGSTFAIVARDGVQIGLFSASFSGVPAGAGRCYCKLSGGIDALYADYLAGGVAIRHPLRDESYGMREFMIADLDRNELNFGEPQSSSRACYDEALDHIEVDGLT